MALELSRSMEEWKEYKLGEICGIFTGKKDVNQTTQNGEYPFFSCAPNPYKSSEYIYDGNAIIVAGNGSFTGRVSFYKGKFDLYQRTYACTPIIEDLDFDFLYYYMKTFFEPKFMGGTRGSSIPYIVRGDLANFVVELPSLILQQRISSIFKSLDDKIDVNRRINENLEQQAQVLFKSWFVDFEPFKDQPFVESELGMIPQGWRVGRYDDIIDATISGDWGKEHPEGNYIHKVACIRGCDFQDIKNGLRGKTPERFILEKNFQAKHFKDKDILVEISGGTATVSTGRVCPVSQLLIDKFCANIVCTNFCRLVRPKNKYGAYLYYSWLYKYNNKVMFGYENGTSGIKNFRIKDFTALEPVVIPSEEAMSSFQSLVDKLQMKMQINGSESQKLATLRDTLLPRLMSGELKVQNSDLINEMLEKGIR